MGFVMKVAIKSRTIFSGVRFLFAFEQKTQFVLPVALVIGKTLNLRNAVFRFFSPHDHYVAYNENMTPINDKEIAISGVLKPALASFLCQLNKLPFYKYEMSYNKQLMSQA